MSTYCDHLLDRLVPFEQDYLTAKLHSSQLEKNTKRLRHELAKSRAMNDLLQDEVGKPSEKEGADAE